MSTYVEDESVKQEEHEKRNCLFCKLSGSLEDSEQYRTLNLSGTYRAFGYALLDQSPKVLGHSLVIARKPFDDFTDHLQGCDNQKLKVFAAAIELAENLKRILNAEKVYLMTMCEHWEMWETNDGQTTEHLHFHLVPRYEGMRNKQEAGESLFCRRGTRKEKKELEDLAKFINGKIKS